MVQSLVVIWLYSYVTSCFYIYSMYNMAAVSGDTGVVPESSTGAVISEAGSQPLISDSSLSLDSSVLYMSNAIPPRGSEGVGTSIGKEMPCVREKTGQYIEPGSLAQANRAAKPAGNLDTLAQAAHIAQPAGHNNTLFGSGRGPQVDHLAQVAAQVAQSVRADFREFCTLNSLSSDTVAALINNGVDSILALKSLVKGDLEEIGIPLGQRRIIELATGIERTVLSSPQGTALHNIKPPSPQIPSPQNPALLNTLPSPQGAALLNTLTPSPQGAGQTGGVQPGVAGDNVQSSLQAGQFSAQDALAPPGRQTCRLLGITPQGENIEYLRIVNFVSVLESREEERIPLPDGSYIVQKGTRRKPAVESVSPLQYMEATAKIAVALSQKGLLSEQGQKDYMAYTVMIAQLGQKYTWPSVMLYDDAYRKAQAIDNSTWGSDLSHARDITLCPRDKPAAASGDKVAGKAVSGGGDKNKGKPSRRGRSRNQEERICFAFNHGNPCPRTPCNYRHVCLDCFSPAHGRLNHGAAGANHQLPYSGSGGKNQ